jgi:uncharacterized protein
MALGPVFLAYHLLLVLSATGVAVAVRRIAPNAGRLSVFLAPLALLALAFALAVLVAWVHPFGTDFLAMRLLAQTLFGELPVLAAAMAWTRWRRGARLGAAGPAALCLALLAIYAEAYHREPHDLKVRRHAVALSPGRTPKGNLRIVHLSDIQTAVVGTYEGAAIDRALALAPDVVVLTGDYVHARPDTSRRRALRDLKPLLARLRVVPGGVFAVRGDTDREWPEPLAGLGFHLLDDTVETVSLPGGSTLAVAGLGRLTTRGGDPATLRELTSLARPADIRILIGHNPDFVLPLGRQIHAHLALAGHTHGGQVALPFFGPLITKSRLPRRYASGLHAMNGGWLHVSAGVGMERGAAPQVRFLAPPEICAIEVEY